MSLLLHKPELDPDPGVPESAWARSRLKMDNTGRSIAMVSIFYYNPRIIKNIVSNICCLLLKFLKCILNAFLEPDRGSNYVLGRKWTLSLCIGSLLGRNMNICNVHISQYTYNKARARIGMPSVRVWSMFYKFVHRWKQLSCGPTEKLSPGM